MNEKAIHILDCNVAKATDRSIVNDKAIHPLDLNVAKATDGSVVKKNDIILAASFVVVAIICAIVIQVFIKKDGNIAVVNIDGQVYKTLSLSVNTELKIDNESGIDGYNVLVIENGFAYMKDANCADKICVHQDKISKVGETIVCLPHKVVIEIEGEDAKLDGVVQ